MKHVPTYMLLATMLSAAILGGCSATTDASQNDAFVRPASAATPGGASVILPAGTEFVIVLSERLATDVNISGDTFRARVPGAIVVDGQILIPAGATVMGALQDVQASHRMKGPARMTLSFDSIRGPLGSPHSIQAQSVTLRAAPVTTNGIEPFPDGIVLGMTTDDSAVDGKGAILGSGNGIGTATILMIPTNGQDVELNAGQRLLVRTTDATNVRALAHD